VAKRYGLFDDAMKNVIAGDFGDGAIARRICEQTAKIRPHGYTDAQWLAALADTNRLRYGIKWEEPESRFLRGLVPP
jgi:hypothetical protein